LFPVVNFLKCVVSGALVHVLLSSEISPQHSVLCPLRLSQTTVAWWSPGVHRCGINSLRVRSRHRYRTRPLV